MSPAPRWTRLAFLLLLCPGLVLGGSGCVVVPYARKQLLGSGPTEERQRRVSFVALSATCSPIAPRTATLSVRSERLEVIRTDRRPSTRWRRDWGLEIAFCRSPINRPLGEILYSVPLEYFYPVLLIPSCIVSPLVAGIGQLVSGGEIVEPDGDWHEDRSADRVLSRMPAPGIPLRIEGERWEVQPPCTTDLQGRFDRLVAPAPGHLFVEGVSGPAHVRRALAHCGTESSIRVRSESDSAECTCMVEEVEIRAAARAVLDELRCRWVIRVRDSNRRPVEGALIRVCGHTSASFALAVQDVGPPELRNAILNQLPERPLQDPPKATLTNRYGNAELRFRCAGSDAALAGVPVLIEVSHPRFSDAVALTRIHQGGRDVVEATLSGGR